MTPLPQGTITFLFTDIEGSSRLWERFPEPMRLALAKHDTMLHEAAESRGGFVFKTIGDAFCVAFSTPHEALDAALAAQRLLNSETWDETGPLRVRMALHIGAAELRDQDYFGPALNRVSRLLNAAHGGQILLSLATAELVRDRLADGITLRDLGERRLRDLNRPERIFQLLSRDLPAEFPPLRSLEAVPNNLPAQLTSFIGREREMTEVKQRLNTAPLLTLTGTGGTGKTRLSLQAAADVLDQFEDGVWLVELATVSDPDLVPEAVAGVLGVREEPDQPLPATLTNFLRTKSLLLILDNCEHLVAAVAQLAEKLLRACPRLRILASSREALGIAGETIWPVPPLSLLDVWREKISGPDAAEKLMRYEAVRLFVDRAMNVRPSFRVTNENAASVAEICWRLDGIPLAIELAAARVKVLSVEQIATRLNDRFHLLTGGSRTAMHRQQTLRALIDWSYDLLSEPERVLLRRMAVFAGGRTLEAVEQVCSGNGVEDWEVLDLLTQLVDKSLVTREKSSLGEPRYTMIESVWDFTREKLKESGEIAALRLRHLDCFVELAEAIGPKLMGPEQQEAIARCEEEQMNFRSALHASIALSGQVQKGFRLLAALHRFAEVRSLLHEPLEIIEDLFSKPDANARTSARARALAGVARLAWIGDKIPLGAKYATEALEIFRELGEARGTADLLGDLALYAWDAGELPRAKALLDEAEMLSETLGDKRVRADLLSARAVIAAGELRPEEALALNETALKLYEELGDQWSVEGARWLVGITAARLGDYEKARANFISGLQAARVLSSGWSLPYSIEAFAALAVAEKQYERAARLLGAAEALRADVGISTEPSDHPTMRELLAPAAEQFITKESLAARREGRRMNSDEAVAYALSAN